MTPEPSKIEHAARAYVAALLLIRKTIEPSDALTRRKAEGLIALELLIAACEESELTDP